MNNLYRLPVQADLESSPDIHKVFSFLEVLHFFVRVLDQTEVSYFPT